MNEYNLSTYFVETHHRYPLLISDPKRESLLPAYGDVGYESEASYISLPNNNIKMAKGEAEITYDFDEATPLEHLSSLMNNYCNNLSSDLTTSAYFDFSNVSSFISGQYCNIWRIDINGDMWARSQPQYIRIRQLFWKS